MIAAVLKLLEAIIALPKIGEQVRSLIDAIVAWRMAGIDRANGQAIQDALAFGLKNSETQEGRVESAKRWQAALTGSRPESR